MIIYTFTLAQVAVAAGGIYIISHGWAAWKPEACSPLLRAFPTHYPTGLALLAVGALWFASLMATIDLMEYAPHRDKFVIVTISLAAATAWFVRDLLAVRALGVVLLLAAQILLDAAFPEESVARLVVTVLAYAWIFEGLLLVGLPYIFRDAILWLTDEPGRVRLFGALGAGFGLLLVVLGLFVY